MSIIKPLFFDMECIFCDIQHIPRIFCILYANSSCIFYYKHIWKSSARQCMTTMYLFQRITCHHKTSWTPCICKFVSYSFNALCLLLGGPLDFKN